MLTGTLTGGAHVLVEMETVFLIAFLVPEWAAVKPSHTMSSGLGPGYFFWLSVAQ